MAKPKPSLPLVIERRRAPQGSAPSRGGPAEPTAGRPALTADKPASADPEYGKFFKVRFEKEFEEQLRDFIFSTHGFVTCGANRSEFVRRACEAYLLSLKIERGVDKFERVRPPEW